MQRSKSADLQHLEEGTPCAKGRASAGLASGGEAEAPPLLQAVYAGIRQRLQELQQQQQVGTPDFQERDSSGTLRVRFFLPYSRLLMTGMQSLL
jgi:hypothetical protein